MRRPLDPFGSWMGLLFVTLLAIAAAACVLWMCHYAVNLRVPVESELLAVIGM